MRKARNLILLAVAAILLTFGYVASEWTSYHRFDGKCLDCHLTVPREGSNPGTFKKDITNMCMGCHASVQDLSHPVDVVPSMSVPSQFPLDWKRELSCVSCHYAHRQGYGSSHVRSSATGEGFCTMCHDNLANELHKVSVGTAHTGRSYGAFNAPGETLYTLDELSIRCMACHDAVFANESLVTNKALTITDSGMFHNIANIGLSHPIGMNYYEIKRMYHGAYRGPDELPPQVKLFGGVIGCATCHNPYSAQHDDLVISNDGSALCLACHVK